RAALDRAVAASPDLAGALELRARLHAESGRSAEALADLEACLALPGEPGARVLSHLSAAAICDDALHDTSRALHHLKAALALAPESPEALARLARILGAEGRTAEAAGALRRLVAAPGVPREALVEYLLALAALEERLGEVEAAASDLRRARATDPGHDDAHRRIIALEERTANVETRLASLESAAADARDAALRADSHVAAARLLAGELRARDRAALHLRAALEIDPGRAESRAVLAHLLEEISPADAAAEHRRLIAQEPLRVASWTALYRHYERSQTHDRAYVAAAVLRWLGVPIPGPAAEQLLLEGARQALPSPPPLDDEDLALLRAPGDAWPLAGVIEAAGDAIAAAVGEAPERHGDALRDHPIRRALAEAAKTFGAPAWELYPGTVGRVDVEPAVPYSVLVGPDVARRTTAREQRFLVGRAAARLRTRSCLGELLPPAALAGWIAAAVRSVVPGYSPGEPVDEEMVRRIAKGIARKARKPFEEASRALALAPNPPDLTAWRNAAAASADRAGLVLCGDVPAALGMLLREGARRAPEGPIAVARASSRPDVLSLLAFAATEAHFILRQRLRVAIA
ncbi:MAG TPA: tetratricopeptide repeat protein, partial [Anaeromyxobacter sp.]